MKLKTLLLMTLAALAVIPASRAAAAHIYWCGGGDVYRANLNGSDVEHLILNHGSFDDIAVDVDIGRMYLANGGSGCVQRANLDGTLLEEVATAADLNGIALDVVNDKVYWAISDQEDAIQRADYDGTGTEDVLHPAYLSAPHRLAIDPVGEKVYWTGSAQGSWAIRRVNLDGTGVEDLVLDQEWPFGIALDFDAGKIYWADSGHSYEDEASIRRSNLDGTDVQDLFADARATRGLALDLAHEKVYWTQSYPGEIWRANLDGSDPELVLSGLDSPQGIAIVIPEPSSWILVCSLVLLLSVGHLLRTRGCRTA